MTTTLSRARSNLPSSIALSLAIAATVSLFEPIRAAFSNWDELALAPMEGLELLAGPFLWLASGLSLLSAIGCVTLPRRGVALLTAVLLCLWCQGNLFVWHYAVFDGMPRDWSVHRGKGLLEAAFWLALLSGAWLKPRPLRRHAGLVVTAILILQAVALWRAWPDQGQLNFQPPEISPDHRRARHERIRHALMHYSQSRNVVVVVIDAVQADFFAELIANPTFEARVPPGFTYYRNAVSAYPHTMLSLQNILTSRALEAHPDVPSWRRTEMARALPARLDELGFTSAMLSWTPWLLACELAQYRDRCISHAALTTLLSSSAPSITDTHLDQTARVTSMLGLASFRLAPHWIKPWVYNGGSWRIPAILGVEGMLPSSDPRIWRNSRMDLSILRAMALESEVSPIAPTFKLFHLFGAHVPNSLGAGCKWNGMHNPDVANLSQLLEMKFWAGSPLHAGREKMVESSACILSLLFEYMQRLESIGVYDDSLIFVVADHGMPVSIDPSSARPPIAGSAKDDAGSPKLSGVPLFMAKPISARGPLAISDAPVALCDIPRSVFADLGLVPEFGCESIFSPDRQRASARTFYQHAQRPRERADREGLRIFQVNGHSWLRESWIETVATPRSPIR